MVLDILAISAVIFLAFALLFRKAPIVIKIQVENIHNSSNIPEANLKEMLKEIGKTEVQETWMQGCIQFVLSEICDKEKTHSSRAYRQSQICQ